MLEQFVKEAIRRAKIRPSRARGQHFLINDTVLAEVVRAARLDGSEFVIEIGPGLGTLTRSLAARVDRLYAYELDDKLVRYLRAWVVPETPNLILKDQAFNKYVLEDVIAAAKEARRPLKIVTNLPYQISSAFLHSVIDYSADIELTVVMLQREMAQRITASAGDEGYSSFSLYLQTFLKPQWICDVPRNSFMPPPQVESAVVRLAALAADQQPQPADRRLYLKLIENVFRHRRKNMQNALQLAFSHLESAQVENVLSSASIDPAVRAQDLTMDDFVIVADALTELESSG